MSDYIGITENRLKHILGVARKCYTLAKEYDMGEDFCRRMWLIGFLHDIGYEFSEKGDEHPLIGEEMLKLIGLGNNRDSQKVLHAIRKHGKDTKTKSLEWKILNIADLTVNSKGEDVSIEERLKDIKERYGEESHQYINACYISKLIK